jgi:hypothetical protein
MVSQHVVSSQSSGCDTAGGERGGLMGGLCEARTRHLAEPPHWPQVNEISIQ